MQLPAPQGFDIHNQIWKVLLAKGRSPDATRKDTLPT